MDKRALQCLEMLMLLLAFCCALAGLGLLHRGAFAFFLRCISRGSCLCYSGGHRLSEVAGDVSLAHLRKSEAKPASHLGNRAANPGCLNCGAMQMEI